MHRLQNTIELEVDRTGSLATVPDGRTPPAPHYGPKTCEQLAKIVFWQPIDGPSRIIDRQTFLESNFKSKLVDKRLFSNKINLEQSQKAFYMPFM